MLDHDAVSIGSGNQKVSCCCGWSGIFSELKCNPSDEDIRCPQCGTVGWYWV